MRTPTYKTLMLAGAALMLATAAPVAARAHEKDDGSTTVTLNAEARRMVEQDRVTATLNFEASGATAQAVQAEINAKMQAAKPRYDAVGGVKTSTGQYNVYKDYPREPQPKKDGTPGWTPEEREAKAFWRGSQSLMLDGVKSDAMLMLISSLQKEGFALQGLNFYMSRDAEDRVKDALITEALGNIRARAENIQKALGKRSIHYAKIDLGGGNQPIPMMRSMAMKAESYAAADSMPAPVAEAGETEVVMHVTAEVKLK